MSSDCGCGAFMKDGRYVPIAWVGDDIRRLKYISADMDSIEANRAARGLLALMLETRRLKGLEIKLKSKPTVRMDA